MGWNFRVVNLLSLHPQTKKPSISRAIQSKIQTKRHRSRGGEKASRESQR
ncbi:competence-induced protein ccs1 (pseudogene) [Streptococcus pneumoniae SPNA45]|nr:competence-induced protein ccs1 (pseudogene) [Streptococcus pneumoniae SPNA45]